MIHAGELKTASALLPDGPENLGEREWTIIQALEKTLVSAGIAAHGLAPSAIE
jgi:hypothetical protein